MWNYQCAWKFYLFCRMYSYVEKYCESTCGGVDTVPQRQASRHHNVCHHAQHRTQLAMALYLRNIIVAPSNHGRRCQQHYLRPHTPYPSNRLVSDRLRSRIQGNATIVENGRIFTKFWTSESWLNYSLPPQYCNMTKRI